MLTLYIQVSLPAFETLAPALNGLAGDYGVFR